MTDVWLHGASAGDVRALHPLLNALSTARPNLSLRLTCLTATGLQMAARLGLECTRIRPPIGPGIARAMAHHRPKLVIWEYLELWPAWVRAAQKVGARALIVDGHITQRSQRVRPLLKRAAAAVDQICVRSAADAEQARALGFRPDRVAICGNGKHDGMGTPPQPSTALRDAVGPVEVVLGSLHPDEEADALRALAQTGLRVLIAPRYPRRVPHLLRRARALNVTARRSRERGVARWIILETMGELAAAYALGRVAIVGGTFGARGGQTMVEPAAHGRPVLHGPQVSNIQEEVAALTGRGAWQVESWTAAVATAHARLDAPGPDPRLALSTLRGATARNLAHALRLLG